MIAVAIGRVDVTRHIHSWNFPEGYAEAAANTRGGPILKCVRVGAGNPDTILYVNYINTINDLIGPSAYSVESSDPARFVETKPIPPYFRGRGATKIARPAPTPPAPPTGTQPNPDTQKQKTTMINRNEHVPLKNNVFHTLRMTSSTKKP